MTMRLMGALALLFSLSSCSIAPDIIVVNNSGHDVVVPVWGGSILPHNRTVRAGATSDPIPTSHDMPFEAGGCSYTYPGISVLTLPIDRDGRPTGGRTTLYRIEIQPDFSLRFFPLKHDGTVQPELTGPGFPARPQVDCRMKG